MNERTYGVILRYEEKRFGLVRLLDGRTVPFVKNDFQSTRNPPVAPERGLAVRVETIPNPAQPGTLQSSSVRPLEEEEAVMWVEGAIVEQPPDEQRVGRIRLAPSSRMVSFWAASQRTRASTGTRVKCLVVQRNANDWVALVVQTLAAATPQEPELPVLFAGATIKGTGQYKSVNEDAYLATTFANGELWLCAVADGITARKVSWWASRHVMELLWDTKDRYKDELLRSFDTKADAIVLKWINDVHERFVEDRKASTRYQEGTATLTLVLGKRGEKRTAYASCGDSMIYNFSPGIGVKQARSLFDDSVLDDQRTRAGLNQGKLLTDIGADRRQWEQKIVNSCELNKGTRLVVCTDGVFRSRRREGGSKEETFGIMSSKFKIINSLSTVPRDAAKMADAVERALVDIQQLGEPDDLTMVLVHV